MYNYNRVAISDYNKMHINNINMLENQLAFTIQNNAQSMCYNKFYWLYNEIVSDYRIMTFVLTNIMDLNTINFNSIYNILRSTLEKYADFLNLYMYREKYLSYMEYLYQESNYRVLKKTASKRDIQLCKEQLKDYRKEIQDNFFNSDSKVFIERKTRYKLLESFNQTNVFANLSNSPIPMDRAMINSVINFNKDISFLDSKYSRFLHNSSVVLFNDTQGIDKAKEIMINIHFILYTANLLLWYYFGANPVYDDAIVKIIGTIKVVINNLYDPNNSFFSYF